MVTKGMSTCFLNAFRSQKGLSLVGLSRELWGRRLFLIPISSMKKVYSSSIEMNLIRCSIETISFSGENRKIWNEIPVSGITTLWVCHLSKEELQKRQEVHPEELRKKVQSFLGVANLCNLHVTVFDCALNTSAVQIFVRATQGANFNRTISDKAGLYNLAENLHRFFCGSWEPISVGTCTRKTGVSNIPEYQAGFWYNYSGVGYSASGASLELLSNPIDFAGYIPRKTGESRHVIAL